MADANQERLKEVTSELGKRYKFWKGSEKEKNTSKTDFFELADEAISESELSTQVVVYRAESEEEARKKVKTDHPVHEIKEVQRDGKDFSFVLIEKPEYKNFTFVNPDDQMVYARQVAAGSPVLDEEAIKAEDPELYEEITEPVRVIKPLGDLETEQLAKLRDYVHPGKPIVKLAAPRKAKPEELE